MNLIVSECFYSIQGEGITTGVPAYFVRLTSCNLLCGGYGTQRDNKLHGGATWRCDTIEVWTKGGEMTFEQLVEALGGEQFYDNLRNGAHLIFTGGEPLMQQDAIKIFLERLLPMFTFVKPFIEVETNGTVMPSSYMFRAVDQWNVSPKLSNSGMPANKRIKPTVLKAFNANLFSGVIFKFVVGSITDWEEICIDFNIVSKNRIVLMPAASDEVELKQNLKLVAEIAKANCLRMCGRMQISIWDKLTGV